MSTSPNDTPAVRVPIISPDRHPINWYGEITPAIARRIVALAGADPIPATADHPVDPHDMVGAMAKAARQAECQHIVMLASNPPRCQACGKVFETTQISSVQGASDLTKVTMRDDNMAQTANPYAPAAPTETADDAAVAKVVCHDEVRCHVCGNKMIGVEINEVATLYGCPRGCSYSVLDDDDLHKLSTPKEIADLRAKLDLTQRDRAEQQRVAMESEREAEAAKSRAYDLEGVQIAYNECHALLDTYQIERADAGGRSSLKRRIEILNDEACAEQGRLERALSDAESERDAQGGIALAHQETIDQLRADLDHAETKWHDAEAYREEDGALEAVQSLAKQLMDTSDEMVKQNVQLKADLEAARAEVAKHAEIERECDRALAAMRADLAAANRNREEMLASANQVMSQLAADTRRLTEDRDTAQLALAACHQEAMGARGERDAAVARANDAEKHAAHRLRPILEATARALGDCDWSELAISAKAVMDALAKAEARLQERDQKYLGVAAELAALRKPIALPKELHIEGYGQVLWASETRDLLTAHGLAVEGV